MDLSIGQPDFPVPDAIKVAAKQAIDTDRNGYTITQGLQALRSKLRARLERQIPQSNRDVMITSGTSGGLLLALMATVNPGDEVIILDPYFVAYPPLIEMCHGIPVMVDTYPSFHVDVDRVKAAISPRTKVVMFNSPANPSGAVASAEIARDLAAFCAHHGILLISDEIYREFCYDGNFTSPAETNPDTLVVDGFGKSHGCTGWRLGFAHGPKLIIEQMAKLQQFTFVCAPSIAQHAGLAACDFDVAPMVAEYRCKRDRLVRALNGAYDFVVPGGAFYLFARAPGCAGSEFVRRAAERELLMIPGCLFSQKDTHFRLSYAASDATLDRGIDLLLQLAH